MTDNVNHPAHYTQGGIECIEAIKASMTPEAFRGYLKGNVENTCGGMSKKVVWNLCKKHSGI